MQRKVEIRESRAAWQAASAELDSAIGIELDEGNGSAAVQTINIRRFRQAIIAERAARLRYAAALVADGEPLPDDLLWDIPESERPDRDG